MNWTVVGAACGFLAVGCGAFGAHALKRVATPEQLAWWATGAQYHLVHAVAIVLVGLLQRTGASTDSAGWAFLGGLVLFSGTLYGMGLGGPRWLGAITPLGGLALMLGWVLLVWAGRR